MLYKLSRTDKAFDSIEPVAFQDINLAKDLEDLIAKNLLDVLFEGNQLMPIFQERKQQPEADIYALSREGDLVIFELKRGSACSGAVHQALRYCETAAHWTYEELQIKLAAYTKRKSIDLQEEHQTSFDLERLLDKSAFNRRQHLIVIGSAADHDLIRNITYWKSRGLWVDFIPYRIYKLGKDSYLEFFSIPYDQHSNPSDAKGVIFDTNRSYDSDAIWYMCENDRVASFGDRQHLVSYLREGDHVFLYHLLYHLGGGLIAAGKVKGKVKVDEKMDACYRDLEWLTAKPKQGKAFGCMCPAAIEAELGHGFFWARTIKTPYLTMEESQKLLKELINHVGARK